MLNYRTTGGVDRSDSVVVEISDNGGASWSELENFTGISGATSGARSYDISAFIASNTQIRFRVNKYYGGSNEEFRVDNVEITAGGWLGCENLDGAVDKFVDRFDSTSYSNSDGSHEWSGNPWIETGDNNSPSGGNITVEVDRCPSTSSRCIEFDGDAGVNAAIERQVDLSGADAVMLVFDYRLDEDGAFGRWRSDPD